MTKIYKHTIFFVIIISIVCLFTKEKSLICKSKVDDNNTAKRALYYMQKSDIAAIIEFKPKIAIVDPDSINNPTNFYKYTKEDTAQLLKNGIDPIAYLSIGEAEDYRDYWKNIAMNEIVGNINENWVGNYRVRFWKEQWESIIFNGLDSIMDKGFKGVFLDVVDVYQYWGDISSSSEKKLVGDPIDQKNSADRMISFVKKISRYCKAKDPKFQIIVQNALGILQYDLNSEYISSVDGLSIESLWYNGTKKLSSEDSDYRLNLINKFKEKAKYVIVTDYVYDKNDSEIENDYRVSIFIKKCKENDFYYYAGFSDKLMDKICKINLNY